MYLSSTLAVTLGLPLSGAVMQGVLRGSLRARLVALGVGGDEIGRVSPFFRYSFHLFLCWVWVVDSRGR
jgi:hypothetical protein